MRITFPDRVLKVERKSRIKRGWVDVEGKAQVENEDLGWFIQMASSKESFSIGMEEPKDVKPGMLAKVSIEIG